MARRMYGAATALTLALVVTGCSSPEAGAPDLPVHASPSKTSAPAPSRPAAYAFGQAAKSDTGLTITVSDPKPGNTGNDAIPENTPFYAVTVTVENGGTEPVDLADLSLSCQAGGQPTDQVFTDAIGYPTSHVLAGKTASFPAACTFPNAAQRLQVEISADSQPATDIWAGDVR